jgi:dihydropteroate synthase
LFNIHSGKRTPAVRFLFQGEENMPFTPDSPPRIIGILNITPDSFSDGGIFLEPKRAVEHALAMEAAGADVIDIGGESTRPGARRIPEPEQLRRVLPVIRALRERLKPGTGISIDTTLSGVAEQACAAGATILNDISAGEDDPEMFHVAAKQKIPIVLMHKQGVPGSMQERPEYGDVVTDIRNYLLERAQLAIRRGVSPDRIILDPGIGFGKTLHHNLQILANLSTFTQSGYPILLGASRKASLAQICAIEDRKELVGATCATTALGVFAGVGLFRVHDVKENRQAAAVAWAIKRGNSSAEY